MAFHFKGQSEALPLNPDGSELPKSSDKSERSALGEQLMERVCDSRNIEQALKCVKDNRGSPGVDGMTVKQLPDYLKDQWPVIKQQLLTGTYRPQPVKRVEIPKPGGGVRRLGIPTVFDRLVQQALLQVLQPSVDTTFSNYSYGFRPKHSAHQAVAQAQKYLAEGRSWLVDLDLEKFFDRVNHDKLMGELAKRIKDKRTLKVIRGFLNSGVMEDGLVSPTREGTPQGGPLSPLLSNIVLDKLDKELEHRHHSFVRYADDCNIYVQSERAGMRVMKSITQFIEKRLKLKVNEKKSAVAQPTTRKFLGFSFTPEEEPKRRIAPTSIQRFKDRIRELTSRTRGISFDELMKQLRSYVLGWLGYFSYCQTPSVLENLQHWTRRRLRAYLWVQWKNMRTRQRKLHELGVPKEDAWRAARLSCGTWRSSTFYAVHRALRNRYLHQRGLPKFACLSKA